MCILFSLSSYIIFVRFFFIYLFILVCYCTFILVCVFLVLVMGRYLFFFLNYTQHRRREPRCSHVKIEWMLRNAIAVVCRFSVHRFVYLYSFQAFWFQTLCRISSDIMAVNSIFNQLWIHSRNSLAFVRLQLKEDPLEPIISVYNDNKDLLIPQRLADVCDTIIVDSNGINYLSLFFRSVFHHNYRRAPLFLFHA